MTELNESNGRVEKKNRKKLLEAILI